MTALVWLVVVAAFVAGVAVGFAARRPAQSPPVVPVCRAPRVRRRFPDAEDDDARPSRDFAAGHVFDGSEHIRSGRVPRR